MGGTWAYYTIYVVVFMVVTFYAVLCICKETEKFWVVINALLICVFMACYILADNRLPLGCTGSLMDIRLARDGLKVALFALTSIIFIYSLVLYIAWYFCKKAVKQ